MEMEDGDVIDVCREQVISVIWDSTNDSKVGSLVRAGYTDPARQTVKMDG